MVEIVGRWTLTSSISLRSVNNHAHFVPRNPGTVADICVKLVLYIWQLLVILVLLLCGGFIASSDAGGYRARDVVKSPDSTSYY